MRIISASLALSGVVFIGHPRPHHVPGIYVIGNGMSLAISGRSSTQPLAILIHPPHSVSCSDPSDRLFEVLLRHVNRQASLGRAAIMTFIRSTLVRRTLPAGLRASSAQARHDAGQRAQELIDLSDRGFTRKRKADRAPQARRRHIHRAAHAMLPLSRSCKLTRACADSESISARASHQQHARAWRALPLQPHFRPGACGYEKSATFSPSRTWRDFC